MRTLLLSLTLCLFANAQSVVSSKVGSISGSATITAPLIPTEALLILKGEKIANEINDGQAVTYQDKTIHGDIIITRSYLSQPITLTDCTIKGSLIFSDVLSVKTIINLEGTKIRGELNLSNTSFDEALTLNRVIVDGDFSLRNNRLKGYLTITQSGFYQNSDLSNLKADKGIKFTNSNFRETLSLNGSTFNGLQFYQVNAINFDARNSTAEYWVSLSSSTFSGEVLFDKAIFDKSFSMAEVTTYGKLSFEETIFKAAVLNIDFYKSNFLGFANFRNTQFEENVRFAGTTFKSNALFIGAHFDSEADFSGTLFHGPADFTDAFFRYNSSFKSAHFFSSADFSWAKFGKIADFNNSHYYAGVFFNSTTFNGFTKFFSTKYDAGANFDYANFNGELIFHESTAKGDMFFRNVIFNKTTFASIRWYGKTFIHYGVPTESAIIVDFSHSRFLDDTSFQNAGMGGFLDFSNLNFHNSVNFSEIAFRPFDGLSFANLMVGRNANFTNASFLADSDEINFSGARVMGTITINGCNTYDKNSYNPFE